MNEEDFINSIKHIIDPDGIGLLDYNDDAVAIPPQLKQIVINTDSWVASTDRPQGMSSFGCGYRASMNAISDVIAKGATPKYLLASFVLEDILEANEIVKGIAAACDKMRIVYLGGDTNQGNDLVIGITVIGITDSLIHRKGAKIGEFLYWIGPDFGETAAALGILLKGWNGDKIQALKIMEKPELFPEFLKLANISSAIDCSDGLARSLYLLATSSNCGFRVTNYIVSSWAKSIAELNRILVSDLVFYGGEELGIIFTSPTVFNSPNVQKIGHVISHGIYYLDEIIPNKGWSHFLNSK